MVYRGRIKNGVVVFDTNPPLVDGTEVRVEAVSESSHRSPRDGEPPIWEKLRDLAGTAHNLPVDLAERHDHYRRERHQ